MLIKDCLQKTSQKDLVIPKGEFVNRDKSGTSWCLSYNSSIEVSCQNSDLKIVPHSTAPYLTALSDVSLRFDLYIYKRTVLNRAINMVIGQKVNVLVEIDGSKIPLKSIIRYKGSLPNMPGCYFGVELLVGLGTTTYVCMHSLHSILIRNYLHI